MSDSEGEAYICEREICLKTKDPSTITITRIGETFKMFKVHIFAPIGLRKKYLVCLEYRTFFGGGMVDKK